MLYWVLRTLKQQGGLVLPPTNVDDVVYVDKQTWRNMCVDLQARVTEDAGCVLNSDLTIDIKPLPLSGEWDAFWRGRKKTTTRSPTITLHFTLCVIVLGFDNNSGR
jgi:hypothetical protein